jgi:hypothetical protein
MLRIVDNAANGTVVVGEGRNAGQQNGQDEHGPLVSHGVSIRIQGR